MGRARSALTPAMAEQISYSMFNVQMRSRLDDRLLGADMVRLVSRTPDASGSASTAGRVCDLQASLSNVVAG